MNWDLIAQIILAIIALFGGLSVTIIYKAKKNKNNIKIKGDNNIIAGGSVSIERGNKDENTTKH